MSDDLFAALPQSAAGETYDGSAIEVLEGLEPVRRRPGMYIGGIDERALHHLAAEVLDNAMDEAVAGHANRIEVTLEEEAGSAGRLTITDNGRGFDVPSRVGSSYGLKGMLHRIQALHGSLTIESGTGKGTRLAASVPKSTREQSPANLDFSPLST